MYLEVFSPFDRKLIKKIKMHKKTEALSMIKSAYALFNNRKKWMEPYERIDILNKTAASLSKNSSKFAKQIALEGGKPIIDANIEVTRAIDGIGIAVKELLNIKGEEVPMGLTKASEKRMAFTFKEPIGVVLAISAFNHPLNLIIHQVIPALAVGCPVIVKPATTTPLSCLAFVDLLYKAGLPKDWCQVCVCDNNVASELVNDKRFSFLSFIGSAKVGWMLKKMLNPGVCCALEHGGAAPVIIDKDIDHKKIIAPLIKGAFYHAGQVCVSVQRIFVHESKAKLLAEMIAKAAKKLKVGDPTKSTTDIGPLILPREVERVNSWVSEAVKGGAKLLTGGKKLSNTTYAATVLFNPDDKDKVSVNEIFGPVVCIYSYKTLDEAVKRANNPFFSFQAAIFSDNLSNSIELVKKLNAKTVMVNDHTAFRVDWMPFGGTKNSGYNIGGIGHSMNDMTHEKMMVINLGVRY